MKPAIPAVVLALTLSALTVQAADSISGASRRTAKSAAVIPKNIDAVTSASVVPQALRQSVKPKFFIFAAQVFRFFLPVLKVHGLSFPVFFSSAIRRQAS